MQVGKCLCILIVGATLSAAVTGVFGDAAQNDLQGGMPYTPTRLEFLAVELNAYARLQTLDSDHFTLMFSPRATDDTIIIFVRDNQGVDFDNMRNAIKEARGILQTLVGAHGWNDWVRVTEDIGSL